MADNITSDLHGSEQKGFDDYKILLGDMLRGERATSNKSLIEISQTLLINPTLLKAIEDCDLKKFPILGFIPGYVRAYANYFGLDADKVFEQFCHESGFKGVNIMFQTQFQNQKKNQDHTYSNPRTPINDANFNPIAPNSSTSQGLLDNFHIGGILSIIMLLTILFGVGFAGFQIFKQIQQVELAPIDQVPNIESESAGLIDVTKNNVQEPYNSNVTVSLDLNKIYPPQDLQPPLVIERDGPIANLDPEKNGIFTNPEASDVKSKNIIKTENVAILEPLPPPFVDILAVRPAWVRIRQQSGDILFEKIIDAGQRYRIPTNIATPILRAGNSSAVYIIFGDKIYGPLGTNTSVVKNVILSESEISSKYKLFNDVLDVPLSPPINLSNAGQ